MASDARLLNLIVICNLFSVVLCESYFVRNISYNYQWSAPAFLRDFFLCTCEPYNQKEMDNKQSIIFFEVYGRLANRMLGYALTLSLKREFGFRTFLKSFVIVNLQYYFEKVDQVSPLENLCHEKYPWMEYLKSPQSLVEDGEFDRGHAINYMDGARLMGNNINGVVRWGVIMEKNVDEIRKALTLKRKFVDGADEILADITHTFHKRKKRTKMKKEIVYVGVHLRQTDAQKDIVNKYRLPELRPSYYLSAMGIFAEKFPPKKFHLIFVLISDDISWVKLNVYNRAKNNFNVFIGGTGDPDDPHSIGVDLALMSRMNHTILSYGTFSFWSGFLSGGKRLFPSLVLNRVPAEKIHPLDRNFSHFTQPDQGLKYHTKQEEMESGYYPGKHI